MLGQARLAAYSVQVLRLAGKAKTERMAHANAGHHLALDFTCWPASVASGMSAASLTTMASRVTATAVS